MTEDFTNNTHTDTDRHTDTCIKLLFHCHIFHVCCGSEQTHPQHPEENLCALLQMTRYPFRRPTYPEQSDNITTTRHRAITSMYSLTFSVRVMSPECHHWKPAVQAAAVMLRTPPTDGQSSASQPRALAIYGAQFWERPHHPPVTNQQRVHTLCKLNFALCCHSNATRAPIANPPNSAQLEGSLYHAPKLHAGPCSSVGVWPQTDTHTHTDARDHNTFCVVYDSRKM